MSKRSELIISELTEDKLKALNKKLEPLFSDAPISQCFAVFDLVQEQAHQVLIHLVNSKTIPGKRVQTLIKFSERHHAPPFSSCLKLATPIYYRKYEGDVRGVHDEWRDC